MTSRAKNSSGLPNSEPRASFQLQEASMKRTALAAVMLALGVTSAYAQQHAPLKIEVFGN